MEPINSAKKNSINLSPPSDKPSDKPSEKSSEKPSRPVLTRINTGDRIMPKIIEPNDDKNINHTNNVSFEIGGQKQNQDININMLTSQIEEFFVTSPTDSSIDISVRDLKSDESDAVLVALVDREIEMKDLFIKNEEYFEMVKNSIFSSEENGEWQEFLTILYSPRDRIPDLEWMNKISGFLEMNPQLLANFKEMVGFYDNIEDHMTTSEINEDYEDEAYTLTNDEITDIVDIISIRDRPKILENILNSYPQFFINAQQVMSQVQKRPGNHDNNGSLYDEFKKILTCPRSEMSDDEWEIAIYECLDPWPQLVAQFEEIVAYEINEIRND
ncbi:10800_t:CDS:2 [Cetraspora pellucida]|uniref:10800_t:CDS:1 n=1 Tax=Cetraspora pellucida TaxID=1433469 RepID=A0A9N8VSW1_9GLOM|nr:10800_t:CDS:2 [Cetraspora pellucida]